MKERNYETIKRLLEYKRPEEIYVENIFGNDFTLILEDKAATLPNMVEI